MVMRALSPVFACLVAVLAACQDSAASNSERDTHMGDVRAVPLSSGSADAAPAAAGQSAKAAEPVPAAAPAPASASAAGSASAVPGAPAH
jgi:hypothetical protein